MWFLRWREAVLLRSWDVWTTCSSSVQLLALVILTERFLRLSFVLCTPQQSWRPSKIQYLSNKIVHWHSLFSLNTDSKHKRSADLNRKEKKTLSEGIKCPLKALHVHGIVVWHECMEENFWRQWPVGPCVKIMKIKISLSACKMVVEKKRIKWYLNWSAKTTI